MKKILPIILIFSFFASLYSQDLLTAKEFISITTSKNPEFEQILIDELAIKYNKYLNMPSEELLASIKSSYALGELDNTTISLSKLFLNTGSTASFSYYKDHDDVNNDQAMISFTQNLFNNAFGKTDKLKFERIDKRNKALRFNIVEVYEKYVYQLLNLYYLWTRSYENLQLAKRNYDDSLALYKNMKDKKSNNIVTKSDLSKSNIQVIIKKQNLETAETVYKKYYNQIKQALRVGMGEEFIPNANFDIPKFNIDFLKSYQNFKDKSRTYQLFELTSDISLLDLKITNQSLEDDLGLTINLSDDDTLKQSFSASITYTKGFLSKKNQAKEKVQSINHDKNLLIISNDKYDIETQLLNLYEDIRLTEKLIKTTEQKISQAKQVVREDKKYYQQGRLSFNDYVDSINQFEQYKYERINEILSLKILILKWKEVTDILIKKQQIMEEAKS